ncbi:hypothetical protein S40293_08826 [Stachybotrys chartarum IBT 40293]|nr:hypothetical protein S40293_08826 [Stachybotrys chartarum IBT 40293]
MSERKVLSKYYPHDFDPRQVPRTKKAKGSAPLQTVRLMAPFPMQCTTCGQYIGKGTKFNARRGTTDETYLGIIIFRFFIRCPRCAAEITFKTDPKASDYACERGATRIFEAWRLSGTEEETTEERLERLEQAGQEHQGKQRHCTTIELLEKHTLTAETDIAVADALDEVRLRNAWRNRVEGTNLSMTTIMPSTKAALEEQDAQEARKAFIQHGQKLVHEDRVSGPMFSETKPIDIKFPRHGRCRRQKGAIVGLKRPPSSRTSGSFVQYCSDSE